MTEDIVNAIKEILRCYDICQRGHPSNQEIHMWRERFLATADLPKDPELSAKIWCSFLCMPSENFMEKTPETNLKDAIQGFCNDH